MMLTPVQVTYNCLGVISHGFGLESLANYSSASRKKLDKSDENTRDTSVT